MSDPSSSDKFHVRIKYENLLNVTGFCGKVSKTGTDPESKSIIIRAERDTITVETLGTEIWAKTEIEAEVHTKGRAAVQGKFFADIVAALSKVLDKDQMLDLSSTGSELIIEALDGSCRREVTLMAFKDDEFVGRPDYNGDSVEVQLDFLEHIKVANTAAADPKRPMLSGVHIHPGGLVATDSYKVIMIDLDLGEIEPVTINSTPIKFFPEPSSYGDGDVYFGTTGIGGLASFKFGRNELISTTMSTDYPKVEMIKSILPPEDTPNFVELETEEFKNVIEALKPFDTSGFSPATIYPDGRIIIITPEQDTAEEKFDYIKINLPTFVSVGLSGLSEIKSLMRGEDTCKFLFQAKEGDMGKKLLSVKRDNITFGLMPHVGAGS